METNNEQNDLKKELASFEKFMFGVMISFFLVSMFLYVFKKTRTDKRETAQIRVINRPNCIDRTIPNKIQHNPVKHCKLMLNDKGKLIIQPC